MNILNFEMNVPKEVALQSTQGTLVQGRYGDRVMFQLAEGGVMYVPPIVATKIEEQSIAPGERFQLCKSRVTVGRRCSIDWQVRKKEPEADLCESQLESDLRRSIEAVTSDAPQLVPPNRNGASGAKPPAQNGCGAASTPTTKLEHALKTAITAASNAEKFGAELGYVVRFDSDAIKSMAITVLINMSEGGRR